MSTSVDIQSMEKKKKKKTLAIIIVKEK